MKNILKFICAVFMIASLGSCSSEGSSEHYYLEYGEIADVNGTTGVLLDNGVRLFIRENKATDLDMTIGNRVYVSFTVIGTPENDLTNASLLYVKLNAGVKILCKKPTPIAELDTQAKIDSVGNDPVNVNTTSMWFSANKYLNIPFSIKQNSGRHLISLILLEQNDNNVTLELRHNAHDDFENKYSNEIASFIINDLFVAGKDDLNVTLKYTDYNNQTNTVTRKLTKNTTSGAYINYPRTTPVAIVQ